MHAGHMKLLKHVGCLLVAAFVFAGCNGCKKPAVAAGGSGSTPGTSPQPSIEDRLPKKAQPKLQTVKVWLGAEELVSEVAMTTDQTTTGMMFRTNVAENESMIFVHPFPYQAGYWMKNCFVPLSIAYIDTDGVILEIHDMQAQNTNTVLSTATNVRFALETSQGWFDRHNVRTGMVVRTERGSLAETFLRNK